MEFPLLKSPHRDCQNQVLEMHAKKTRKGWGAKEERTFLPQIFEGNGHTINHQKPEHTELVMTLRPLRHRNSKVDSRIEILEAWKYLKSSFSEWERFMARILLLYFCEFSGKREIFPRGLPLEKWQNIDNIVLCIIEMFPIHTLQESQLSSENSFSINSKTYFSF